MQILDLTDKLARFPIAYGYQPVRGWSVKHFDTPTGTTFQRTKQNALGEGPWDACERLYVDAFPIDPADFVFHPGLGNDTPDANFPNDAAHPWTSYISAKCRSGISEDQTEKLFGIYRTLRTGNYNGSGQQLNSVGTIVTPSDPRTEFFFKNNPANIAVDQILRWGLRLNNIVNWPAWVNWRDYNDELIPIDDSKYTPRSVSLTPTSGGSLSPGTYYVRVSTMKSADQSSASLKTIETKYNAITLTSGQTAFQVNWLIKGDEEVPPSNPSGITSYRVYIGTTVGVWLGYFTVSNPASRTFLVTTTSGTTAGNPIEIATSGLLTNVKRFECGLFFIPPYDLGQALDLICQISCADWQWSGLGTNTYRNDKIRFMSPADRAPIFTLNLAETGMGSLKTYPVDRRNRPNQIVVNFRDQDDEFLGPAQPVILDREQLQEDDGLTKTHTIEGGTMRRNQAQRVASFYARVLCDMDQMATLIASPKTYHVLPGDTINVTNPMPGWTDQKFIVRKKSEKVETSLGDDILAQVYTNGLYSDTEYQPLPLPLPTPRLDPFADPPVATNLVLTEVNILSPDFSYNTGFQGTFDFGTFFTPQIARVFVKGPSVSEPPDSAYNEVQILVPRSDNTGFFEFRGLAGGHYWVKVVTESSLGSSATSGHPVEDIILSVPLQSVLKIMDNVPPKDDIIGLGLSVGVARSTGVGSWLGVQLWRDRGYGYELVAPNISRESTIGHSTNNSDVWLAATGGKIYFVIEGGNTPTLTNATTAEIAAGKNNLFIGREKIGVQTWTNLGGGIWKGENLVRGLNHTEIFQNTHTAQEDIILLDENMYFIPMEFRDIGKTLLFKAVTFGLAISAVTAISCNTRGDSNIPYAVSNLAAYKDSTGDWYISAVGNPRVAEIPESYIARIRRASDAVLMRDIPLRPGLRMAAILAHIINANGGGTWSSGTHAIIDKNNVIGEEDGTAAYVTQPFERGGEITCKVTVTPPPSPYLSGNVKLSLGPSDFTDPFGTVTGATLAVVDNSTDKVRINVYDWSTNQYTFFDLPAVNGVVYVRLVWSGTELRWQFSGSPINPADKPQAILKDVPNLTPPVHLRVSLINSGPTGTNPALVENIIIGGLSTPQVIYSLPQQQNDNSGNSIAVGNLDVEFWQVSQFPPDFKGFPVRKVF